MNRLAALFIAFSLFNVTDVRSDDLWIASGAEYRGRLRVSEGGTVPRIVYTRASTPNPAFPNAIMRVSQIAIGREGDVYFCSGLDGSLMQLLEGRHEIQKFEFPEQIRDIACGSDEHTVYFSVVPTPQNGEPLADGRIYRRDLWEGQPTLVATIRQSQVGGNWWGLFTIVDDRIFIATADPASRLFQIAGSDVRPEFVHNAHRITGLGVAPGGEFVFTDGSDRVLSTRDFNVVTEVLRSDLKLSDVASRALETAGAP